MTVTSPPADGTAGARGYGTANAPVYGYDYKCKRCLLSELPDKQLYQTVQAYITVLPEYEKAAPDEYRRRLSICGACDELSGGVCRQCGCFVEARAAKQHNYCAKDKQIW